MVMVRVPVVARDAVVNLRLDVPVPVMDVGVKVAVTPDGKVLGDKVTVELNPPETVLVMLVELELPRVTLTVFGEALRAKLGGASAVTVRVTVAVLTVDPDVPVMVMG
jgi:hypothetical protein